MYHLPVNFTFKKQERLKRRKLIQQLFQIGHSKAFFPIRIIWLFVPFESPYPAQAAFSVPKKKINKAAHRNRIKRQMRDIYRLQKHLLYPHLEKHELKVVMMFLYLSNEFLSHQEIKEKMEKTLDHLSQIAVPYHVNKNSS